VTDGLSCRARGSGSSRSSGDRSLHPFQDTRCPRLTRAEGSEAATIPWPLTPPSRITAPPPHLNGEEFRVRLNS